MKTNHLGIWVAVFVASGFCLAQASDASATTVLMKLEGKAGDVTRKGYDGWFSLKSAALATSRKVDFRKRTKVRNVGSAAFDDFKAERLVDEHSAQLLESALRRTKERKIVIAWVDDAGATPVETMRVTLYDVVVAGYSLRSDGADFPVEAIELDYRRVQMTVGTTMYCWDVATERACPVERRVAKQEPKPPQPERKPVIKEPAETVKKVSGQRRPGIGLIDDEAPLVKKKPRFGLVD